MMAAAEVAGTQARMNVIAALHPARVSYLPRMLLYGHIRGQLRERSEWLSDMDGGRRTRALDEMPGLARYLVPRGDRLRTHLLLPGGARARHAPPEARRLRRGVAGDRRARPQRAALRHARAQPSRPRDLARRLRAPARPRGGRRARASRPLPRRGGRPTARGARRRRAPAHPVEEAHAPRTSSSRRSPSSTSSHSSTIGRSSAPSASSTSSRSSSATGGSPRSWRRPRRSTRG